MAQHPRNRRMDRGYRFGNRFYQSQIEEKLALGFDCIKLKIGALDFELECSLLSSLRQRFDKSVLQIRVDANGAFSPEEALGKLERLSQFDIHSIEHDHVIEIPRNHVERGKHPTCYTTREVYTRSQKCPYPVAVGMLSPLKPPSVFAKCQQALL